MSGGLVALDILITSGLQRPAQTISGGRTGAFAGLEGLAKITTEDATSLQSRQGSLLW